MPHSMTGYGRAVCGAITVELRSVNHRYLDCSVRVPRSCVFLEEPLKALVTASLSRGKIEVNVTVDFLAADTSRPTLNRSMLEGYLDAARILESEFGLANDIKASSALRFPDVIAISRQEPDTEAMTEQASAAAKEALLEFCAVRGREGERLALDITQKLTEIERIVTKIEERLPAIVAAYRDRLCIKMADFLEQKTLDETRILTEAAIFADRVCSDEETVRLRSHIAAMRGMLSQSGALGRKMDFLTQEFSREANTIGSKCSDTETVGYVVDLKSEIEKIREQVQNIE